LINVHIDAAVDDINGGEPLAAEWSANTQIGLSSCNTFMLGSSASHVQEVFQATVELMEKYVMFTDAYPNRNPCHKFPWARQLLVQAARDVDCDEINIRLHHDAVYAKIIADAVSSFTKCFHVYLISSSSLKLVSVNFKARSSMPRLAVLRACTLSPVEIPPPESSALSSISDTSIPVT
jgi:hypothetical protein